MGFLSELKAKLYTSSSSSSSIASSNKKSNSVKGDSNNYRVVRHYVPVTYANSPNVERHAPPTFVDETPYNGEKSRYDRN